LQAVLCAPSACASASGRTDSGLAAGRSSAVPRKTPCLQADSGSSEPKSFCGPAEGRVFCLLAVSTTLAATARSCGQRPPGRYQRSRSLGGQSGFSPETAGSTSARSATRRAMAPRAVSFLRRTASEAAARCPSPGACAAAVTRGHRRGCRFPSASRRLRAPGLGSSSSSMAGVRTRGPRRLLARGRRARLRRESELRADDRSGAGAHVGAQHNTPYRGASTRRSDARDLAWKLEGTGSSVAWSP
jgi:hypothetical protein